MKRAILLSALMLFFAGRSRAQFKKGSSEISFLGSMGSYNDKQSYNGQYDFQSSQSYYFLSFATTYDYYIDNGFSVEPEVDVNWIERSGAAVYILPNVSYTQMLPKSNVALFGRVGYGFANGIEVPMFGGGIIKTMDKLDVGVLNVGAGTKIFVGKSTLVRLELNYRSQSWTNGPSYATTDNFLSSIALYTGISILF